MSVYNKFDSSNIVVPAKCVVSYLDLPEWSSLNGRDSVSVHDVFEDMYKQLVFISRSIDLSSLGKSCMSYKLLTVASIIASIEDKICSISGTANGIFYKNCPECHESLPVVVTERDVPGYPFISGSKSDADMMARDAIRKHGQSIADSKPLSQYCRPQNVEPSWSNPTIQCINGESTLVYKNANPCYKGQQIRYVKGGDKICNTQPSDECEGKTDRPVWSSTYTTRCGDDNKIHRIYTNINYCYTGSQQVLDEVTSEDCGYTPPPSGDSFIGVYDRAYRKSNCSDGREYGSVVYVRANQLPGYPDSVKSGSQDSANTLAKSLMDKYGQSIANENGECNTGKGVVRVLIKGNPCASYSLNLNFDRKVWDGNDRIVKRVQNISSTEFTMPADTYDVSVSDFSCIENTPSFSYNETITVSNGNRTELVFDFGGGGSGITPNTGCGVNTDSCSIYLSILCSKFLSAFNAGERRASCAISIKDGSRTVYYTFITSGDYVDGVGYPFGRVMIKGLQAKTYTIEVVVAPGYDSRSFDIWLRRNVYFSSVFNNAVVYSCTDDENNVCDKNNYTANVVSGFLSNGFNNIVDGDDDNGCGNDTVCDVEFHCIDDRGELASFVGKDTWGRNRVMFTAWVQPESSDRSTCITGGRPIYWEELAGKMFIGRESSIVRYCPLDAGRYVLYIWPERLDRPITYSFTVVKCRSGVLCPKNRFNVSVVNNTISQY